MLTFHHLIEVVLCLLLMVKVVRKFERFDGSLLKVRDNIYTRVNFIIWLSIYLLKNRLTGIKLILGAITVGLILECDPNTVIRTLGVLSVCYHKTFLLSDFFRRRLQRVVFRL